MEKTCSKCRHLLSLDKFRARGDSVTKSCIGCLDKAKGKRGAKNKCKDDRDIEYEVSPLTIDREIRGLGQDQDYLLLYTLLTYDIIAQYAELIGSEPCPALPARKRHGSSRGTARYCVS